MLNISRVGTRNVPTRRMIMPVIAAVLFAVSVSAAWADAADRDFPDNPIAAEQYFHDHQAQVVTTADIGPARTSSRMPVVLKTGHRVHKAHKYHLRHPY